MARPSRQVIDYFSHDCQHTKSLEIIEGRFGIVGYGVWFKLLEALGTAEGHFLDFSDEIVFEYFSGVKCRVSGAETELILILLARLKMIDPESWENRVVWCQHFVDRLAEVYNKRKCKIPGKPDNRNGNGVSDTGNGVSAPCSPGNDTKERRGEKSILNNSCGSKKTDPRVKVFLDWYFKIFQQHFKRKYAIPSGGKTGKQIKSILSSGLDFTDIQICAMLFVLDTDPFLAGTEEKTGAGYDIGIFLSRMNKYDFAKNRNNPSLKKWLVNEKGEKISE